MKITSILCALTVAFFLAFCAGCGSSGADTGSGAHVTDGAGGAQAAATPASNRSGNTSTPADQKNSNAAETNQKVSLPLEKSPGISSKSKNPVIWTAGMSVKKGDMKSGVEPYALNVAERMKIPTRSSIICVNIEYPTCAKKTARPIYSCGLPIPAN